VEIFTFRPRAQGKIPTLGIFVSSANLDTLNPHVGDFSTKKCHFRGCNLKHFNWIAENTSYLKILVPKMAIFFFMFINKIPTFRDFRGLSFLSP